MTLILGQAGFEEGQPWFLELAVLGITVLDLTNLCHFVFRWFIMFVLPICSQQRFSFLHKNYGLSMTLKIHVILSHYQYYFETTNTNFKDTNAMATSLSPCIVSLENLMKFIIVAQ